MKILPYIQQIYGNYVKCSYNWSAVDKLIQDSRTLPLRKKNHLQPSGKLLEFGSSIAMKNVSYKFPGSTSKAVSGVSIDLKKILLMLFAERPDVENQHLSIYCPVYYQQKRDISL